MILVHVKRKARKRASEWFCAINLALFGLTLLAPGALFSAPAYAAFQAVLGETGTGVLAFGLGLVWVGGLVVNGARQGRSLCHQMLMGEGKTTVVAPLLALLLGDGTQIVMQVVHLGE